MISWFATVLALLLSLFAAHTGVPVQAVSEPRAQEESAGEELSAAGEDILLRAGAHRLGRAAALAARRLALCRDEGAAARWLDRDIPSPRFLDARHLVPRFGE